MEPRKVYLRMVARSNNTAGETLSGNSHFINYPESLLLKLEDSNPNKQASGVIGLGKQVSKLIGWFHGNFTPPPTGGIWLKEEVFSRCFCRMEDWRLGEKCRSKCDIQSGTSVPLASIPGFRLFPLEKNKTLRIYKPFLT